MGVHARCQSWGCMPGVSHGGTCQAGVSHGGACQVSVMGVHARCQPWGCMPGVSHEGTCQVSVMGVHARCQSWGYMPGVSYCFSITSHHASQPQTLTPSYHISRRPKPSPPAMTYLPCCLQQLPPDAALHQASTRHTRPRYCRDSACYCRPVCHTSMRVNPRRPGRCGGPGGSSGSSRLWRAAAGHSACSSWPLRSGHDLLQQ